MKFLIKFTFFNIFKVKTKLRIKYFIRNLRRIIKRIAKFYFLEIKI